jgi:methionine-rich copper-binding protein CopC
MTILRRAGRRRPTRPAARFDRLEPRLALSVSAAPALVIATNPGAPAPFGASSTPVTNPPSGSILAQAPASIAVTFNRPIAGESFQDDFRLDLVAPDGSESPLTHLNESAGATAWQVVVTPATTLGPGHYRLYLLGRSPLAPPGTGDTPVDDFTVAAPTGGISTAIDLGSPVGTLATGLGSLDLADNPAAMDYYRIELPQGHFWRLGAEVDDQRIGSALQSSLTIYNSQGQAILGKDDLMPGDANDPYVYLGLNPGVYYIGVSGLASLPAGEAHAGGAFRLEVTADPADAPTRVVSSKLNFADPTEDVPTGLTLQFSGPLDESALAFHAGDAIQLVDASGHPWAADVVAYDAAAATATFVFEQALPAGQYRVQLARQGGLVDLVGKPPVAPGRPAGTLAVVNVRSAPANPQPEDFGPVFLNQLQQGVSAQLQLAPGEQVTYRFVLTAQSFYDLETTFTGSAPTFTARAGGKAVSLDPGLGGTATTHLVHLPAGVLTLTVTGGSHGSAIDWSFLLQNGSYDLLLDNGVGQASGLGLRLVAPDALDTPAATGLTTTPSSADSTAASASATTPSTIVPGPPAGPTALFLTTNVGLIGHPSLLDEAVAVVGPVAPGGMSALASSAAGIPQGLAPAFGQGTASLNSGAIQGLAEVPEPLAPAADIELVAALPNDDLPPLPEPPAAVAGPIDAAPGPGLIDRLSDLFAGLVPSRRSDAATPATASLDDAALAAMDRVTGSAQARGEEEVESADLSSPLGLGVIVVAGAHYGRRVGSWLERKRTGIIALGKGPTPSGPRRPTV